MGYIAYDGTHQLEGLVLADRERNMHDDSDFYVLWWDDEAQQVRSTVVWTTRCGGGGHSVKVDATPVVVEAATRAAIERAYNEARVDVEAEHLRARKRIERGSHVRVVKGRKVAKGTEGYVGALWPNNYSEYNLRVGLQVGDELKYTYLDNLELVEPNDVPLPTEDDVKRAAWYLFRAQVDVWATPFAARAREIWEEWHAEWAHEEQIQQQIEEAEERSWVALNG